MHCIERQIEEERLVRVLFTDDPARFFGNEVRGVACVHAGVVVTVPVENIPPEVGKIIDRSEPKSVLMIEPALRRPIGGLELTEMPFPGNSGFVAGGAQHLRQCLFLKLQPPGGVRPHDGIDAGARRIAPRHQGRAGGRTHRLNVKRFQNGAATGDLVEVRRLDVLAAIEAGIGVAHVVSEDEDDVGFGWFGGLGRVERGQRCQQQGSSKCKWVFHCVRVLSTAFFLPGAWLFSPPRTLVGSICLSSFSSGPPPNCFQ
jgi:hypothetical protein